MMNRFNFGAEINLSDTMKKLVLYSLITFVLAILAEIGYTSVMSAKKVAYSNGVTGKTQKTPATQGCTCHGGQTSTLPVSITGAASVSTDSAQQFSFSIGGTGSNVQGGFNLAVSNDALGFLVPVSSNVSFDASAKELYHNTPKAYASGSASWNFKFVPTATSNASVTLYGVGLNGNGSGTGGDIWNYASKTINIVSTIPTGTSISPSSNAWDMRDNFPLNQANAYDRFASIYPSSDIAFGKITRIGYFIGTEGTTNWPFKIYLKQVTASTFTTGTTVNTELAGATLVYNGTPASTPVAGWLMIPLDNAFDYTANNLEVIVLNEKGTATADTKQVLSRYLSNASQYWSNTNSGTTNGTVYGIRPNLRVETLGTPTGLSSTGTSSSSVSLSWTAAAGSGYRVVYKPSGTSISSATDGAYADVSGNSQTSYTVTGLPNNRSYVFKVYGKSGNILSANGTSEVTATTQDYTSGAFVNEQPANLIFGQSSLEAVGTANEGGLSASSLSAPASIFADSTGTTTLDGKFYIADQGNNRVLIYNYFTPADKPAASAVLGQPVFTTGAAATTATGLSKPSAVWVYNHAKIIVSDSANHRVLIWNTVTPTNGQAADIVLGQSGFTSGSANRGGTVAANTLSSPEGIVTYGNKLLVADAGNNRVLVWNNITTLTNGQAADVVIGQAGFTSNITPSANASTASTLSSPRALGVTIGGKLLIASRSEHRVLVYNSISASNAAPADLVLGQVNFTNNQYAGTTNDSTFGYVRGLAVSPVSDRIAIAEEGTERVLIWNSFPTVNNQKPSVVLGKPTLSSPASSSFSNQSGAYNATSVAAPRQLFWSKGARLYVAMPKRNGVSRFENGDVLSSGPTALSASTSGTSIDLSWTGGTAALFRVVYKAGFIAPADTSDGIMLDNLTGSSVNVANLECNTAYTFRIWGKEGNQMIPLPANTVSATKSTGAGVSCSNFPMADGAIYDMAISGTTVYVAGDFTEIGGQPRKGLAAFNAATNALLSWNPGLTTDGTTPASGTCLRVSGDGSYVYVGGNFNFVGTNADTGLAKISTSTGISVMSYPNTNAFAAISQMALASDNTLYIYGSNLTQLDGYSRNGSAAVDASGNVKLSYNPNVQYGNITTMQVNDSNTFVYFGQYNTSVSYNGVFHRTIAEVDATTGALTSFDPMPGAGSGVNTISLSGNNTMYICGSFNQVDNLPTTGANTPRRGIAKLVKQAGVWTLDMAFAPTDATNSPNREFGYGTARHELMGSWLAGNKLYLAGAVTNFNGTPRYGFIALDTANASLVASFNPGVSYVGFTSNFRMTGSSSLQKIFTAARSSSAGTHVNGRPFNTGLCQVPTTQNTVSVNKMVKSNAVYDFTSSTGVDISFSGNTGGSDSGLVTVDFYNAPAFNIKSLPVISKGAQRWIIHAPQNSSFSNNNPAYTTAEVRFDLDEIPGRAGIAVGNEPYVKVFKRNLPNGSDFLPAFTDCGAVTYDATTHEIKVSVTSFGEFVFGSNLIGPSTLNGTTTNNSINLSWSGGNVSAYRIVYKTGTVPPADVNDGIVIDQLSGTSYSLTGLECNTMYSFRIWGEEGTNYTTVPATAVTFTTSTTSGSSCLNFSVTDGYIRDMVTYGTTLYVTGDFTQIGGLTRKGIAALDGNTNTVLSWNPSLTTNGTTGAAGNTIRVSNDGSYVFVGGSFSFVGSNPELHLAKISTSTGISVPAYPDVTGASVQSIALAPDNTLYFYADGATALDAMAITGVGAVNPNETVKTGFDPHVPAAEVNRFRTIHVNETNTRVYFGHGNASVTYNGVSRPAMAEVDAATGTVTSFNAKPSNGSGVFGIVTKGNSMWICGSFTQIDDLPAVGANTLRRGLAKFNWNGSAWSLDNNFAPTDFTNSPNAEQGFGLAMHGIRNIWLDGNRLYATGALTNFGGVPRYAFLAVDTGNAALISNFNPGTSYLGVFGSQKTAGSATLQRLYTTVGTNYSGQHVAGRAYTSSMCIVPLGQAIQSVNRRLNGNGLFDYTAATGVDLVVTGSNGTDTGYMSVEYHPNAAYQCKGLPENQVSNYRWIIHAPQGAVNPLFTNLEVRFDLDEIPNRGGIAPGQEASVKIYSRPLPSTSVPVATFSSCGAVTYDAVTHELKVNVTQAGEFIFTSNTAALPVELTHFSASATDERSVQLEWQTASEHDHAGFILERSNDAVHFEQIGAVSGSTQSMQVKNYMYTDQVSLRENPLLYYRLKQVDMTGAYTYSKIAVVKYAATHTLTVYPNPASDRIRIDAGARQPASAEIIDLLGKSCMKINANYDDIGTSVLMPGVYMVRVNYTDGSSESTRLIKE